MGTTGHHGAHECRELGSAGVCSELCLCAAAGGAQDREEPGLEGVLEHGCGSGRSDSRPLRASGPGAHGWEGVSRSGARAGMRYAIAPALWPRLLQRVGGSWHGRSRRGWLFSVIAKCRMSKRPIFVRDEA